MQKIKKPSTNTKKDENENMLLEYIEDIDDNVFKEYSNRKNFNSFINEFDCATNEENKKKVVKELKDINSFVKDYTQMEDDYSEYKSKLFDIINAVDYFCMNTLKIEQVILNGEGNQSKLLSTLCN